MFPHTDDRPTLGLHTRRCIEIAIPVGLQLLLPVVDVDARSASVVSTAVPEAPVDEDRDLVAREHHVGSPPEGGDRSSADTEPQSESVEVPTQGQFRFRVRALVPDHDSATTGARRPRLGSGPRVSRCCHEKQTTSTIAAMTRSKGRAPFPVSLSHEF